MDVAEALSARVPVLAALGLSLLAAWLAPRLRERAQVARGLLPARWRDAGRDARVWRDAALATLLVSLVWAMLAAPDYGYNIDESFQSQHGRDLYDWYARALASGSAPEFRSDIEVMNHYGGFFELPAEAAVRLLPADPTLTRHRVGAAFAVLGLAAAYALGAVLHSRAAGLLALAFLLATPRFMGHAFSNPKDVPFAVCMLLALLAICRALPRLPRLPLATIVAAGAAIGAAMGVRIGGVLALVPLALGFAWWLGSRPGGARPSLSRVAWLCASGLGVLLVAWVVMLVFWPWAQGDPLVRPFQAIAYFRDIVGVQGVDFPVFYEGRFYRLSQIPRRYTLVWLLISLPEFALAAPLAGPALRSAWRRGLRWPDARGAGRWLVLATLALALATTADPGVIQYDGVRHFLFVLPPGMVLLAIGVLAGLERTPSPRWRVGAGTLVASLWALTLWDAARLHPYEYTYFNRSLAGGQAIAARSFETDYLGLSYREAVRWAVANVPPPPSRPLRITICKGWHASLVDALAAAGAPPARYVPVPPDRPADLAVAITRADCPQRFPGRVLAELGPAETPLVYVIELHR